MSITSPIGIEDAIVTALLDLATLAKRRPGEGVSQAAMAGAIGISEAHMSRVLHGQARLRLEYIPRLPAKAFDAAMSEFHAHRATAPELSIEDQLAQALTGLTHSSCVIAKILEDHIASAPEIVKARLELRQRRAQLDTLIARLDRAESGQLVAVRGDR